MNREDVEAKVLEAIEHIAGGGPKPTLDQDLSTDLGLDSLDMVELAMKVEDLLNVDVPDSELGGVKTGRDIVELVMKSEPGVRIRHDDGLRGKY